MPIPSTGTGHHGELSAWGLHWEADHVMEISLQNSYYEVGA